MRKSLPRNLLHAASGDHIGAGCRCRVSPSDARGRLGGCRTLKPPDLPVAGQFRAIDPVGRSSSASTAREAAGGGHTMSASEKSASVMSPSDSASSDAFGRRWLIVHALRLIDFDRLIPPCAAGSDTYQGDARGQSSDGRGEMLAVMLPCAPSVEPLIRATKGPDRARAAIGLPAGQADGAGGFEQGIGDTARAPPNGVQKGRRHRQILRQRYCEVCIDGRRHGIDRPIKPEDPASAGRRARRQVLVLRRSIHQAHDREARRQPCVPKTRCIRRHQGCRR